MSLAPGQVTYLPVDETGRVSVAELVAAVTPTTAMVSLMHSNNETGTFHPIQETVAALRAHEASAASTDPTRAAHPVLVHTDCSQSLGKVAVSVSALGVDYLTVAGHKLYAPKGVGALFVREGSPPLAKLVHGAGHEAGQRAGTENMLLVVGLGKACQLAEAELASAQPSDPSGAAGASGSGPGPSLFGPAGAAYSGRLAGLRDRLSNGLRGALAGVVELRENGHPSLRLPNTLSVSFAGLAAPVLLARIEDRVAASAGSACHATEVGEAMHVSHVLRAMGVPVQYGNGTLRLSVGRYTTEAEVDAVVVILTAEVKAMVAEAAQ